MSIIRLVGWPSSSSSQCRGGGIGRIKDRPLEKALLHPPSLSDCRAPIGNNAGPKINQPLRAAGVSEKIIGKAARKAGQFENLPHLHFRVRPQPASAHPLPLPASGEREGPAKRVGEGHPATAPMADAVVVLGCRGAAGLTRRLDYGLRLFQAGAAPLLLLSGGGAGPCRKPKSCAGWRSLAACLTRRSWLSPDHATPSRMRARARGCCDRAAGVWSCWSAIEPICRGRHCCSGSPVCASSAGPECRRLRSCGRSTPLSESVSRCREAWREPSAARPKLIINMPWER